MGIVGDPLFGPAAPDLGWVPAPRYLLRRRRILRQLRDQPPGEVLEIGAGAGMLLQELAARGFTCSALETSDAAREVIARMAGRFGGRVELHDGPGPAWRGRFPLLLAFEVLEHIEDDAAALREWVEWMAPGGTLLLSVPAHPGQWNAADVWAGHFRRYRRQDLVRLLERAGLTVEHVECYGFPLGNLTERLQARGIARSMAAANGSNRQQNNDRSGIERGHVLRWFPLMQSLPGRVALHAALALQALASRLPLGNGYLLRARKPA